MQIIIKKHSDSKRFFPHENRALGKFIHTKKEYLGELKSRGLEPYDEKYSQPDQKTYKPSKKCQEIVNYLKQNTDKKGNVHLSTKVRDEIGAYLPKKG